MELRWGQEILRFELQPDGEDGCVLLFTNTFDELGKAARDGAGWHSCLDLLGYDAGGERAPWSSADRHSRTTKNCVPQPVGHSDDCCGHTEIAAI